MDIRLDFVNLHDNLPFNKNNAGSISGTFTGSVGMLKLSGGEWDRDIDVVAIAFYLFTIRRFVDYGLIILYDDAI